MKKLNGRISAEKQISKVDWDGYIKKHKEASASMKEFLADGSYGVKSLKNYQSYLNSSAESTSKFSTATSKLTSGLKNIAGAVGSSLLNFGASMAVMAAITLVAKGIDYLIHYQDKLIEKGEKAKETISNTFDEFSSKKTAVNDLGKQFANSEKDITSTGDAIDSIGKKYTEFKQGIDRGTNKNIGLSDSDYQSYLDLSNQLAEQFPTLVSGYDAQGNAILNLGSNAEIATAKIKELYDAQMLSANVKIGEQLDDNYKGVVTQIDKYQGEIGEWKTKVEKNKKAQKDVLPSLDTISSGEIKFDAAAFGKNVGKVQNEINTILMKNGITVDENSQVSDDGTVRISAPKLSEGVSNEINKVFQKYGQDAANSLAIDNTKFEKQIHANELLIKDQLKSMTDSIGQYMQTSEVFTGLNSKLQDAFITNLPNLDINTISEDYGGDVQKFLYNEFLTPMENLAPESQQKLAGLLSLDPKNLNIQEYRNLIDKTLKAVFTDKTERSNFKKALGLDTVVDDAKENLNRLKKQVSGFNTDLLNTLSIDEIKQGLDITANDKFSGTFEEFVAKIKEAKSLAETAIDIKANPKFDAIAKADETANAGDDYVKSIQYAKDAKEMYDKGLIGTDDFKTRAAYFSPTGADDDVNFAENYPKISRYMTEDATGVQNFLNDLKSKGLATFETLSDGTKKWSYDIQDLEESATNMGMGFEWFMDMFGRLEDYGFHNNFVGSVEEGTERITDLSTQLVDAQAELERLKATGADSTAISQQEEKVAQLKSDIEQTTQATKQLQEHAVEQYAKQIESAKTQISSLNEQRKSIQDSDYGGNGAAIRKLLGDKIKELADSNGIELDANLNIVNEDETIKALEGQKITVPIEYEQVDYKNIDKIKEKASKALEDGKFVTKNAILSIDLDSTSTENIDKQLSSLSDALSYIRKNNDGVLNIDSSEVQNALNILNALYAQKRKLADEKFDSMDLSGMDKSLSSAIEKLHKFQQIKIELDRRKNLQSVGIQIDTSETQDAYDKIVKQLQNLDPEIQAKLGIDTSSEESIMQWIESFNPQITAQLNIDKTKAENELRGIAYSDENEIIMKVNADTSQIENAISSLQNGQSATFNASVTDSKGNSHDSTLVTGTKDEKGVIHYYAEFEDEGKVELEKNQDGKLVYKADVKDVEDKVSDLKSENPKVKVELTPEEQKVQDALKSLLNDQTKTTFSVDADFSKVKDDINALEVGHSIVFTANVDGVDQAVAAVKNQDGTIKYTANVAGVPKEVHKITEQDGTIRFTTEFDGSLDWINNNLKNGETITYKADVSGIQKDIEACKDENGTIHYYSVMDDGSKQELTQQTDKDGKITYVADTSAVEQATNETKNTVEKTNLKVGLTADPTDAYGVIASVKADAEKETIKLKGSVDLTNRPQVDAKKLKDVGWEDVGEGTATVFSSSYSNEKGDKTIVVTPILPNGDVLEPEALSNYAEGLLAGQSDTEGIGIRTYIGDDSIAQSDRYAESLHKVQEAYYLGDDAQKEALGSLSQYNALQLKSIDTNNMQSTEMGKSMSNLMNSLGVGTDSLQEFVDVLTDMNLIDSGIDVSVNAEDNASEVINKVSQEEINDKIVTLVGEDNASDVIDVWNTLSPEPKFAELSADDQASVAVEIWNGLSADPKFTELSAEDQASLVVNLWNAMEANPKFSELSAEDKATAFVDAYNGLSIEDKHSLISQSGGEATAGVANSVSSAINNIPSSKTSTITTVYRAMKETISNGVISKVKNAIGFGVAGTAHLTGTAFAGGSYSDSSWINPKWQTKNSQVALVGEKSQELVVDPSSNSWYTVGDNGAEFRDIPKGAIIFNSKQTKELFSQGFTKSRGKGNPSLPGLPAFLEGSAFAGGSGSGGFRGGASKYSSSKKKSSKSSSNSSSSSSKSNSSSDSSASKETENLVDFIKILYDRVSRLSDLAEKAIDRAVGLVNKQTKATDAIDKVRTELSTAQHAANKYLEYANGVGLSEDYKRKIREGNLSIENITDENLKDKVSKYQSYYEDYLSYSDKALDLQDKLADLAEKRLSIIEDEYDAIEDIQKSLQDKLEADRDLLENLGTAIDNSLNTNSIKDAINSQAEVYNDLTKKLAEYQTEVQSQLNSGLMKKGSEQWYNAQKNINDFTANIAKASSELIELQDKLRQISYDTLQNIIEGFSRSTDKIGSYIELLEAKNERVPEKEYQKQLDNNNAAIKTQYDLRNKYLAEQAYYDVNSKRYQELAEKINDADVNILKLQKDNEDLKDSIYSLRIKNLEDAIKGYADLEDELSNFRDLLNDDAFFDKQGGITDEGLAQITLLSQSLGNAKQKIADYTTGLQKIKELYENGVISLDEYNEKTKEYRDGIQASTKDVKSYQDSLTDLYLKAMQTEVDYLDKIISKRKEALDKKKSYYEYDKKIKSQSKDINSIKAQIQALEGVNKLLRL